MKIEYTKLFLKQLHKLRSSEQKQFVTRMELWLENPRVETLHLHSLTGKYKGAYSINITGDIRAIFLYFDNETIKFVLIGSHSQIYG